MPIMSSVNPMSLWQYRMQGENAGLGSAIGGGSNLAGAMIQGPMMRAQGAYLGSQTAQNQANTAAVNQLTQGRSTVAQAIANPSTLTDPGTMQRVAGAIAADPQLAGHLSGTLGTMMALARAQGGAGAPTEQQVDAFNSSTGNTAMGNTPTGFQADLGNRVRVANIGAGATLGAARIGANASMANTQAEIAGENARAVVPVQGPGGAVSYMPAVRAGATGANYYDSNLANTIAGITNRPVQVAGSNGTTTLAPTGTVENQGLTVRLPTVAAVQGGVAQDVLAPSRVAMPSGPPQATPPSTFGASAGPTGSGAAPAAQSTQLPPPAQSPATPPNAGPSPLVQAMAGRVAPTPAPAPGAPVATTSVTSPATPGASAPTGGPLGITPTQQTAIRNNVLSGLAGRPAPPPVDARQAAQMNVLINSTLKSTFPSAWFSRDIDPSLTNLIAAQAGYLFQTGGPNGSMRGDMAQAVGAAVNNVIGVHGEGAVPDNHLLPGETRSRIIPRPGFQIQWPAGMTPPRGYGALTGASGGSPLAGTMTAQSGQGAPPPPQMSAQEANNVLAQAQAAIAQGANPALVSARLRTQFGLALPGAGAAPNR